MAAAQRRAAQACCGVKHGLGALLALALLSSCVAPKRGASPLYVSDERGDAVMVIDAATGQIVRRLSVGKRPRGIRLSPDGAILYVAVSGSAIGGPNVDETKLPPADHAADGIAVVDTASGALRRVIEAGSDPESFALSADGKTLFVSNEDASQVSIVDSNGATPTRHLAVGDQPEGVAIGLGGTRLFVACEGSDRVEIFDLDNLRRIGALTIPGRPRTLLSSADGKTIYASIETAGKLAVIPASGDAAPRLIDLAGGDDSVRPMGMVEAPDGRTLYVTTGRAGLVLEVDLANGKVVRRIPKVGARPWGIARTRDGDTLITANGPSGDISLIDRATGRVRARFKAGVAPWGVVTQAE